MTPNRAVVLTRHLKRYDRRLSAQYAGNGMINIVFSDALINNHVMCITDNWNESGTPVLWGIEPIIQRLRQINASESSHLEEIKKRREKAKERSEKDFKNQIRDGLHDRRKQFAKSFEDINTSTLDKTKDKRRIKGA